MNKTDTFIKMFYSTPQKLNKDIYTVRTEYELDDFFVH